MAYRVPEEMRFLILTHRARCRFRASGGKRYLLPTLSPLLVLCPSGCASLPCSTWLPASVTCGERTFLHDAVLRDVLPLGSAQILCTWSPGHPSGPDLIQVSLGPQPTVARGRQCSASTRKGSVPPAASHACNQPWVCS